ncbi:DUF7507 domain-containing protein [Donghicola eburneus]|uniref:Uncharacterized protein n=1 Tax=Donghicola eburneus TaxID=393278 RepID=A0A1M4MV80_9RHOB|nr:SdrD B-like domain-containing protein [Donghicola eburneus]SCM66179.1 hypothetical protein KARMA_0352 [Donghicola eburneus]
MSHRIKLFVISTLIALGLVTAARAEVVTVPFNEGFVGLRGSNNQDADTVVTFADLGFDATFFTQVSATGEFIGSGAQGNDVAGTLRLRRGNIIYDIAGRIGWQLKEQGNLQLFGFLPNSNVATIALTTPTGTTLPAGIMMEDVADLDPNSSVYTTTGGETTYYITGASNLGVSKFGTSLSDIKPLTSAPRGIDTGDDVGGSADGSGILDALNAYLSTASSQRPLGPITVNSQTTADTTPVVTGAVTLQSGEYLVILINGQVYMTSNGVTGPSDDGNAGTWSIEIPAGNELTAGSTYDVSAMIYNAAGWLLEDSTTNELIITNGVTPVPTLQVLKSVNDAALSDGADVGDTLVYTIVASNTGNVPLYDLSWSDTLTNGTGTNASLSLGTPVKSGSGSSTTDGALLEVGDSLTFTVSYDLTQADIDSGSISNLASIDALTTDGVANTSFTVESASTGNATAGTGNGSATIRNLTRAPAITVTKSVAHTDSDSDGAVSLGDTLTYTVTAENTGNVTLQGVAVEEDFARQDGTPLSPALPALTFTSGSDMDSLLPGAVGVLSFAHVVTQEDVDAGGVTNSATATAWHDADQNGKRRKNGSEDISDTVDQAIDTPILGTPAIALRKSGVLNDDDGVLGTSLGDTITYLLEVKNTGDVTLTNVQVNDPLFGGTVPQTIASLAPGDVDSVTFELTYDVSVPDLDRGYVSNLATASGTAAAAVVSDQSGPTFDTDKEIITFLGSISGHVTDGQNAKAGVTVILIDSNTGQEVATTVTGSDGAYAFIQLEQGTYAICFVPPEGAAVHSHSSKGAANGDLVEGIEVAAGADRVVNDVDAIVVDPSGVIYDAISRTPIQGATVTLLHNGSAVPDSWLNTVAGDANNVVTGADGMYSFLLQSPAQTGTYSLEVSHPSYSFISRIIPPQAGSLTTSLGFGVEEIVASVDAPDAATGDETYYLAFDFTFGDWTDQATLSKGVIHNHIAMDPASFSTGLRVIKVADDSALSERPTIGEVINYTITVENTGDLDYDTVVLDDPLTSNETLTAVAGVTDDAVLNAGETWTYTASYALTSSDLRRGKVENLATLSADLIAGSNAVTGATPTGTDLGGTYVYESAPTGNTSAGTGNGTATVTKLSAGLIDQIKDELIAVIEDDIRVTMQRQTEMVSGWRASALERMKTAIEDRSALRSYETKDPLSGSIEASAGAFALDTTYESERFDAESLTWTINAADLVFSQDEALGSQLMLTFNHRREKLHDSDRLSGRYIGGYVTRTTVDTLAEGEINGFGLNAGLYGASRPYQRLFFDYHLGAVAGKHSYDLDFARDQTINATGDFTYFGVTGGVALSGKMKAGDTIIAPRIGLDGFYTPETSTDVTATSGPFTEDASLDIGSVSSGRLFVEARFSNDLTQAHDGQGLWDGLDAETAFTLRAFCDAFDDMDTRCGAGAGFDFVKEKEDKTHLQKLMLNVDKSGDHVTARIGFGLERQFAKGAGTSSLNMRADHMGNPTVEYAVTLDF